MFSCPLHNWFSYESPCPACQKEITSTTDIVINSEGTASPSTEVKGQQDLKYWKERWSYIQQHNPGRSGNHIEDLINEFLASQPQEVGQDELWDEVGELLKHTWTIAGLKEKLKSKFTLIKK